MWDAHDASKGVRAFHVFAVVCMREAHMALCLPGALPVSSGDISAAAAQPPTPSTLQTVVQHTLCRHASEVALPPQDAAQCAAVRRFRALSKELKILQKNAKRAQDSVGVSETMSEAARGGAQLHLEACNAKVAEARRLLASFADAVVHEASAIASVGQATHRLGLNIYEGEVRHTLEKCGTIVQAANVILKDKTTGRTLAEYDLVVRDDDGTFYVLEIKLGSGLIESPVPNVTTGTYGIIPEDLLVLLAEHLGLASNDKLCRHIVFVVGSPVTFGALVKVSTRRHIERQIVAAARNRQCVDLRPLTRACPLKTQLLAELAASHRLFVVPLAVRDKEEADVPVPTFVIDKEFQLRFC